MADKEPSKNPFVAFKSHIDHHVALTLQGRLGLPSMVSRTFDLAIGEPVPTGPALDAQQQQLQPARTSQPPPPPSSANNASLNSASSSSSQAEADLVAQWLRFVRHSEYSPLHLRHLSRQPTPTDLPDYAAAPAPAIGASSGHPPPPLTFEDAFEDLLAVVQHRGGGIQGERSVRHHSVRMPTLVLGPRDARHVVGELLAKAHLGERLFALLVGVRIRVRRYLEGLNA